MSKLFVSNFFPPFNLISLERSSRGNILLVTSLCKLLMKQSCKKRIPCKILKN